MYIIFFNKFKAVLLGKGDLILREKILFDSEWMFHKGDIETKLPVDKGPIYTQSKTETMIWGPAAVRYTGRPDKFGAGGGECTDAWEWVTLPHDYIIGQTPDKNENNALGYFKYENAWYRKEFRLGEEDRDKRLTLFFEGVATYATVYLNGCILKHNFCGYNSFEVDISDFVKFGNEKNVLAVYVNTDHHEGWWYEGAGIYRHVWLVKTDTVSADLWGVYVRPEKISDNTWEINIETTVRNDRFNDVTAFCKSTVYDMDKNAVAELSGEVYVPFREKAVAKYKTDTENPKLWDIDSPYLYTVLTEIYIDGTLCDTYETRFGFRYFYLDPEKGMFLNGRHVKIKGVCGHQDMGLTGKAVADNVHRYKAKLMKEMGANGYRTSHYPQPEALMDALDELGFIVMDETRWFSSSEESIEQLKMLVKRDRNRPSVFFWSYGNEEPKHLTDDGRRIGKSMLNVIKKLDTTRVIMTAISDSPDVATVCEDTEIIGINYNLNKYDIIHEKYPDKPLLSSECCATGSTRGWYDEDSPEKGYIEAYDKDTNNWFMGRENTWRFMAEREWILGSYQWIAFEHRGETVWPRLCSQSGAIDLFLQKKDAFYQNKSHWTSEPMVHLLPHWNFSGREGELIKVFAYTNCEEAELYLNGESLGKQKIDRYGHGEWQVKYAPGVLEVEAGNNGKTLCRDRRETTGEAKALKLILDNPPIYANGRDVAIITCICLDENGREVPTASPFVSFNTNKKGRIIGTGSDICDHNPVTDTDRRMRAGRITVAVKAGVTPGELKVYARADNLKEAVLTVELLPE